MSNQANLNDPKHHGKNGSAPKPQDDALQDLASAITTTFTATAEVQRAEAPTTYVPLPVDLANLTDEVLAALLEGARAEQQQRKAKREADFFALVSEQAKLLNVTPARLKAYLEGKEDAARALPGATAADGRKIGARAVVAPKYWNPSDHEQRWSGRGTPPPQWVQDILASGVTLEQMLIPEGAL